jgi:hypothetical protein
MIKKISSIKLILISYSISILFGACSSSNKKSENSSGKTKDTIIIKGWIDFEYSKVVAFATVNPFSFTSQEQIVFSNGDSIGVELNAEQLNRLTKMLGPDTFVVERNLSDKAVERAVADCFYPRHNIFFYGKNNKVVQYILVCYECRRVRSGKNNPRVSLEEYNEFFNKIGLKVFDRPDHHQLYYDSLVKAKRFKRQ